MDGIGPSFGRGFHKQDAMNGKALSSVVTHLASDDEIPGRGSWMMISLDRQASEGEGEAKALKA